jgi:hypothetical protein
MLKQIWLWLVKAWESIVNLFKGIGRSLGGGYYRGTIVVENLGPLEVKLQGLGGGKISEETNILISDVLHPLMRKHPRQINYEFERVPPGFPGEGPKLYIEEQFYSVGAITFEEIQNIMDKCIKEKLKLANTEAEKKRTEFAKYDYMLCYETTLTKGPMLEVVVSMKKVNVEVRGFNVDIQIRRDDYDYRYNIGAHHTLTEHGYTILDWRGMDSATPQRYVAMGTNTPTINMM